MSGRDLPDFGARLKRLRRLRGLKQQVVADMAEVCQTTVSRWESGAVTPDAALAERVLTGLAQSTRLQADSALRRLVEEASRPVHLVGDLDHRLLAVSPTREREWRRNASELMGRSLWRYASAAIMQAEHRLAEDGWWQAATPPPAMIVLEEAETGLRIAAGHMRWERLHLADGTPVRLCASL